MKNALILIPPSEGKAEGGDHPPIKKFSSQTQVMLDKLSYVKESDWEKLLGVKGERLRKAVQSNKSIRTAKTKPAIERYTGVVYDAIDYPSLSKRAQKFFDNHVCIVSALFGLVKPRDFIPDYKLKIEKLGADKFWRPVHEKTLKDSFVIDLLPQAHKKAVAYKQGLPVEFVIIKNGKPKPAGIKASILKEGSSGIWQSNSLARKKFVGNFLKMALNGPRENLSKKFDK